MPGGLNIFLSHTLYRLLLSLQKKKHREASLTKIKVLPCPSSCPPHFVISHGMGLSPLCLQGIRVSQSPCENRALKVGCVCPTPSQSTSPSSGGFQGVGSVKDVQIRSEGLSHVMLVLFACVVVSISRAE